MEKFNSFLHVLVIHLSMSLLATAFMYLARLELEDGNILDAVVPLILSLCLMWIMSGSLREWFYGKAHTDEG